VDDPDCLGPKAAQTVLAALVATSELERAFSVKVSPPMERRIVLPMPWQVMMSLPTWVGSAFPTFTLTSLMETKNETGMMLKSVSASG
jgi:hypothetical protein